MPPTIRKGTTLLLLAALVWFLIVNVIIGLPNWLAWSYASVVVAWALWFPWRSATEQESLRIAEERFIVGKFTALLSEFAGHLDVMQRVAVQNQERLLGELAEQRTKTEQQFTRMSDRIYTTAAQTNAQLVDWQIALTPKVQAVEQQLHALSGQAEELALRMELVLIQGDEQVKHGEELTEQVRRLLEQRTPSPRRGGRLATTANQRALLAGMVPTAPAIEEREIRRRPVRRSVRLRTAAQAEPVPEPPQPGLAPRVFGPIPPVPVQVTTYQNGQPVKQREINLRISGKFF